MEEHIQGRDPAKVERDHRAVAACARVVVPLLVLGAVVVFLLERFG